MHSAGPMSPSDPRGMTPMSDKWSGKEGSLTSELAISPRGAGGFSEDEDIENMMENLGGNIEEVSATMVSEEASEDELNHDLNRNLNELCDEMDKLENILSDDNRETSPEMMVSLFSSTFKVKSISSP